MKSKRMWKPPPIFGRERNGSHDCVNNIQKQVAYETTFRDSAMSTAIMDNSSNVFSPKTLDESKNRRGRLMSIAWKPPATFVRHPSTIFEEEEREDRSIKETSNEIKNVVDNTDFPPDHHLTSGYTSKTIATTKTNGLLETEKQHLTVTDGDQEKTLKVSSRTFEPFRKEVARYVVKQFVGTKFVCSNVEHLESKGSNCIDDIQGEEIKIKALLAVTEDDNPDQKHESHRMNASKKQRDDIEIQYFWEGVRMSVGTSARLVDSLLEKVLQNETSSSPSKLLTPSAALTSSLPSSLLPPHIAQTPRRYRSTRFASIIDENEPRTTQRHPGGKPRKLQSLRAMSIARIRREANASIIDNASRSTKSGTNSDQDDTNEDAHEIKRLLAELEEAEKYQRRLEQQLKKAGVVIAEDIPYDLAKQKVSEIAKEMSKLHSKSSDACSIEKDKADAEAKYFKLEQEMEKYITALELTEEWIAEQVEKERKWENRIEPDNKIALKMVLRHMPVDVKNRSEIQLRENPTPNGKFLPRSIAQRFKRTNCLQLLRQDPEEMIAWHPSMFENLRITGLTLTERRALHQHLKIIGIQWKDQGTGKGNKMLERKLLWFETMKSNFQECLLAYERHIEIYGPPGNHPYTNSPGSKGCPMIGKQCPLKADKIIDYSGDYGYPEDSIYFKQSNDPIESNDKCIGQCVEAKLPRKSEGSGCGIQGRRCGPGRGSLLDEIRGRGRGGGGRDYGKVGLLHKSKVRDERPGKGESENEIKVLGRGGRGSERGDNIRRRSRDESCPGRGGLLDEIRGRGRGGKGPDRGVLLDAIRGRCKSGMSPSTRGGLLNDTKGCSGGGKGPGKIGLMDEIKVRGKSGRTNGSGRVELLNEINGHNKGRLRPGELSLTGSKARGGNGQIAGRNCVIRDVRRQDELLAAIKARRID